MLNKVKSSMSRRSWGFSVKNLLHTLSFLLLLTQINIAQGFWTKVGDMPEIRYAHSVDDLAGKIYVVGGMNYEFSSPPTTALVYDRSSGVWTQIPLSENKVRAAHNSCVVGGKLYVVGGNDGNKTIATIDMFDPDSGKWFNKKSMNFDRGLAACASIDGKIYVIGGIRGSLTALDYQGVNIVEVYDPITDAWTQLADMPSKRWGHTATAANGKIYVFGGTPVGKSVEVYDPQTNTWTTKSSMPTFRYCLSSCLLDNNIFVIGGWANSGTGPIYDKVEIYDPVSDKWMGGNSLPLKIAVIACIVVDGKIRVYGGTIVNHPLAGISGIYEFSYHDVYVQEPCIDKVYARKSLDSVLFRAAFSNLYNHQFTPRLICANSNSTQMDSLTLFDDGQHGDLLTNDGVYGAYIPPRPTEDYFILGIGISDHQNNKYYYIPDQCRFTTVGPAVLDSIAVTYNSTSQDYKVKPYIHNNSTTATITAPSVKLICNDDYITSISPDIKYLSNIAAGSTANPAPTFSVKYDQSQFPGYFNFKVEIQSDGRTYWTDSMKAVVTGVEEEDLQPLTFILEQNYPNPFNPTTSIEYRVGSIEYVTLTVYDVLGNEVAVLVNEEKPGGTYEVTWSAENLASGVYFYQLKAGSYVEAKKMILLR